MISKKSAPIGGTATESIQIVGGTPGLTARSSSEGITMEQALAAFAVIAHTHQISGVIGLQTALDGKQAASGELTAIAALSSPGYAKRVSSSNWVSISLIPQSDVAGLEDALAAIPQGSSAYPSALGTPAVGTGTTWARADHVHAMPSASQVGALGATSQAVDSAKLGGQLPSYYALASAIPAASSTTPSALGTAAVGTGTTWARTDHVHAMPSASQVGALGATSQAVDSAKLGGQLPSYYAAASAIPAASSTTPSALGTAAVGTGTTWARSDHVHAMPSASQVGAVSASGGTYVADYTIRNLVATTTTATNGSGSMMIAPYLGSAAGWVGYPGWNTGASGTRAGFWAWSDGGIGIDVASGKTFQLNIGTNQPLWADAAGIHAQVDMYSFPLSAGGFVRAAATTGKLSASALVVADLPPSIQSAQAITAGRIAVGNGSSGLTSYANLSYSGSTLAVPSIQTTGAINCAGNFSGSANGYFSGTLSVYDVLSVGQGLSGSSNGYVQMQPGTPRWRARAYSASGTMATDSSLELDYATGEVSFPAGLRFGGLFAGTVSGAGYLLLPGGDTQAPAPSRGRVLLVAAESAGPQTNRLVVPAGASWKILYRTTAGVRSTLSAGQGFDFYGQAGLLVAGQDDNWHFLHV